MDGSIAVYLLSLLFLGFSTAYGMARPPEAPGHAPPWVSAHRGIMNEAQENTEDGIVASIQRGVPIIDLDIMVTKSGDIVCNHDENVKEIISPHEDLLIQNLSREKIKELVIADELTYERNGKVFTHKYGKNNKFSFLDEVFDKYIDQIIFWLDIKDYSSNLSTIDHDARIVSRFLKSKLNKLDQVMISSTNPFFVIYLAFLAKKEGYFNNLTIGLDYGSDEQVWKTLLLKTGIFETKYGFNFIAAGNNLLTQKMIDSHPQVKVISYPFRPNETPLLMNLYSYLVEFFP